MCQYIPCLCSIKVIVKYRQINTQVVFSGNGKIPRLFHFPQGKGQSRAGSDGIVSPCTLYCNLWRVCVGEQGLAPASEEIWLDGIMVDAGIKLICRKLNSSGEFILMMSSC